MQPIIARLRSLRRERYDSVTGRRRRRGGAALAIGAILALVLGSGIAVAAVSSAQAHTPAINSDCTGVHVEAWFYTDDIVNTVTVTITDGTAPGVDLVETRTFGPDLDAFGKDFDEWFYFPDSTKSWTYYASIDAGDDDGTKGWDYGWGGTTQPCVQPDIGITASTCTHVDEKTTVTAVIQPLDPAGVYKVRLTGSNGYDSGLSDVLTTSASWSGLDPGYDYTAVLTETISGLSDTDTVHAVGCPSPPGFEVAATQCTTVGGNGSFGVTLSGLVPGRDYVLSLVNTAGGTPVDHAFTATAATYSDSFATSPSGTYFVRLTDVLDNSSKDSNTVTYLPCPDTPTLQIDPTACTTTDGTSNATLAMNATGLIPGRSYSVTVVSGATTVYSENLSPAGQSTWSKTLTALAPGTYTLTVTDTTEPATAGFTVSTSTHIKDCPVQQVVELHAEQCTVPGGSGTLTATVTNFTIGRSYTVALTQAGLPVTGQPVVGELRPDRRRRPECSCTKASKPGLSYRVIVQDVTGTARRALGRWRLARRVP